MLSGFRKYASAPLFSALVTLSFVRKPEKTIVTILGLVSFRLFTRPMASVSGSLTSTMLGCRGASWTSR